MNAVVQCWRDAPAKALPRRGPTDRRFGGARLGADDAETWQHVVSLDDELSSSAVRIHYPCMLQVKGEDRLLVVYTRFYLGRKMGLTSPDQVRTRTHPSSCKPTEPPP